MKHNSGPERRMLRETGKRMQSPSARVSAAEGGTQKPQARPFSGVVAPRGVRPPDERQSGSPKKGAAQDEALQQILPAEINFGILDGNAVRFTSLEAWWLVDGVWRPISPDEVLLNAAVMREAQFNQLFPEVPRLPSNAFKADNLKIDGVLLRAFSVFARATSLRKDVGRYTVSVVILERAQSSCMKAVSARASLAHGAPPARFTASCNSSQLLTHPRSRAFSLAASQARVRNSLNVIGASESSAHSSIASQGASCFRYFALKQVPRMATRM